jgi:acyl-CoA synthetase (AMP-forming)/AMP-acid ligase II
MITRGLLEWLESPDERRGIRVLAADGSSSFHSYRDLARLVLAMADRLRDAGAGPGDRVAVAFESGPEFAAGLFGTLAAGATPIPMALPGRLQNPALYQRQAESILSIAQPRVMATTAGLAGRLRAGGLTLPDRGLVMTDLAELAQAGPSGRMAPRPEHALVQFTSGSGGAPKGLRIPWAALEANVDSIRRWLRMTPDDPTATWLPLHHDMGLVGCFVTPVVNGSDLWVIGAEEFIRAPLAWLSCFGTRGARLSASPGFGLAHVLRRVTAAQLDGFDFAAWRTLILGAERIDPDVLAGFHALLAPHGFTSRAFLPAYGLAEATLAVTGLRLDAEPRVIRVDRRSLRLGGQVRARPDGASPGAGEAALVGCGTPLGGSTVTIAGAGGEPVGEGVLGEIIVTGPSVADGYLPGSGSRSSTEIADGTIRTGDAGMLLDGELFVVGRLGDSVKLRARTLFADDLENLVGGLPGLGHARPIVLLGSLNGADSAVLVVKRKPGAWMAEAAAMLTRETEGMPVMICLDPGGIALRTTSGKPRRRPLWNAVAEGQLQVTACFPGGAPPRLFNRGMHAVEHPGSNPVHPPHDRAADPEGAPR